MEKGRIYDGYKGRNLDIDKCITSLKRKKVEVKKIANGAIIIDIEHATPASLGNKSWGMISFLCNGNTRGAVLGRKQYVKRTMSFLGLDEQEKEKDKNAMTAVQKIIKAFRGKEVV